jgi:flavin reductase (DIM6/NTAB) family NADH-FMN oxidoreductase RutF
MVETDYCGIMTGNKTDKAALFDVFYGTLNTAPMIRQCPVNMELKLHEVLDFSSHDIFFSDTQAGKEPLCPLFLKPPPSAP